MQDWFCLLVEGSGLREMLFGWLFGGGQLNKKEIESHAFILSCKANWGANIPDFWRFWFHSKSQMFVKKVVSHSADICLYFSCHEGILNKCEFRSQQEKSLKLLASILRSIEPTLADSDVNATYAAFDNTHNCWPLSGIGDLADATVCLFAVTRGWTYWWCDFKAARQTSVKPFFKWVCLYYIWGHFAKWPCGRSNVFSHAHTVACLMC